MAGSVLVVAVASAPIGSCVGSAASAMFDAGVKAFSGLSNDVEIFADTWAWRPLSTVAARAGVEKHIAEASAASTSRVLGMWMDLWAVTCPTVAPCGGRDEAVKVTKPSTQHVRMKLTEPYRLKIR